MAGRRRFLRRTNRPQLAVTYNNRPAFHARMKKRYGDKKARKSGSVRKGYFRATNPFAALSEEQRQAASRAFAAHHDAQYVEAFGELTRRLQDVDPIQTLAHFAFYDLTIFEAYPDVQSQYKAAGQHHVELLQALFLSIPAGQLARKPASAGDLLEISRLVSRASESFALRRFSPSSEDSPERHFQAAAEQVRTQTQAIRNWGYPNQVFRILSELFEPFDDEVFARTGYRISKLVPMCQSIFRLVEDRFEERKRLARPMMRATSVRKVVETYYRTIPQIFGDSSDFIELARKAALSVDETKAALMAHFDLRLRDCYTFSVQDFQQAYSEPVSREALENLLVGWSLALGDLAASNNEHFFLANPIWEKPLIRLGGGVFFWPMLELFLSFGLEMLQIILKQHPDLYRRYEEITRPRYLEERVASLFRTAFPTANILTGSLWSDSQSKAPYENDLLVCLDSYILIVESKSGKFDASAKRGGNRLKKALGKLIGEPSTQAERFAQYLRANPGSHEFATKRGVTNRCDTAATTHVIQLNVTFELLGPIFSQRPILQKANLLSTGLSCAVTMALTDLESVFELLSGVHQKLHYLERRAVFEGNVDFTADEIDLLAFYLETGFNIGGVEYDRQNSLHLYGLSHGLDPYFLRKTSGENVAKPHLKLTDRWMGILRALEERQFKRWTEIGVCLLNVSFADQTKFERRLKQVIKNVRSKWRDPNHKSTLILENGPPQRRDAIVGYAYKRISREQRGMMIRAAVGMAAKETGADRIVIIAVDCGQEGIPYSQIAFIPSIKLESDAQSFT